MTDIAIDSNIPRKDDQDHIQRTGNQRRAPDVINMEVISISNLSPTVKHLVLHTKEKPIPISFKAGQWVDMIIPGVDTVGGFSICSSPIHLSNTGEISLCVKNSDHPPAHWVHNDCKLGSTVAIRIGGDFFLDTNDNRTAGKSTIPNEHRGNILLVGGGVGINPLFSIVNQLHDSRESVGSEGRKCCLMYSAKTRDELLFKDSLDAFALEDQTFSVQYFLTDDKDNLEFKDCPKGEVKYGRFDKADVERCLTYNLHIKIGSEEAKKQTIVYLCGPPPMIEHVRDILRSLGIDNVVYEKWW